MLNVKKSNKQEKSCSETALVVENTLFNDIAPKGQRVIINLTPILEYQRDEMYADWNHQAEDIREVQEFLIENLNFQGCDDRKEKLRQFKTVCYTLSNLERLFRRLNVVGMS